MQKVIIVNDVLGAARRLRKSIEAAGYTDTFIVEKVEGKSLVDSAIRAVDREFGPGPGKDGIMILDLKFEGEGDYAGGEVLRWMRQNDRHQPVLLSTGHEEDLSYVLPLDLGYGWLPEAGDIEEIEGILGDAQPLSNEAMEKARRVLLSDHLRSHLISDVLSPLLPFDIDLQGYYYSKDVNVFRDLDWANRNVAEKILQINEVAEKLKSAILSIGTISGGLGESLTTHLGEIGKLLGHAFLKEISKKLECSSDYQELVRWLSNEGSEELYQSFHQAYEDATRVFNSIVMELEEIESANV